MLDYSDSAIDNIEHIYCPLDTEFTNYEIILSDSDANDESRKFVTQQYSVAWNIGSKQDKDNILWYCDGIICSYFRCYLVHTYNSK